MSSDISSNNGGVIIPSNRGWITKWNGQHLTAATSENLRPASYISAIFSYLTRHISSKPAESETIKARHIKAYSVI